MNDFRYLIHIFVDFLICNSMVLLFGVCMKWIEIHRVTCVKFPNILNINFSIYGKPMQMKIQNRTVKPKFISDGLYLCATPGNL